MADELVLVNGLPGAGKSTLAPLLAAALAVPMISKDIVKEALADIVPAVPSQDLGRITMDAMWSMAGTIAGTVLLEGWWLAPRDRRFAQAGVAVAKARRVVEVWCDVPSALARDRYIRRQRHWVHRDHRPVVANWDSWASLAGPLELGPTIRVRTDAPTDPAAIAQAVRAAFADQPPTTRTNNGLGRYR